MIHVVIPVRNRLALTRACLTSLGSQSRKDVVVYVIDDGSTDGTYAAVSREFPKVRLLWGDGNLWWSASVNLGIEVALRDASRDDFVLTLNNDTVVRPDYLETLHVVATEHARALIGSVAVSIADSEWIVDGGIAVDWVTARYTRFNVGRRYSEVLRDSAPPRNVSVLSGRGMLIPVEAIHAVGMFDARRLPHYGADYEFARRAQRAGYSLLMSYAAPVFVHEDETGLRSHDRRLSAAELLRSLTDRRSPSNIACRLNVARLCADTRAMPIFFAADVARTWGSAARHQIVVRLGAGRGMRGGRD